MNGTPMDLTGARPHTIACHNCGRPMDGTTGRTMCMECIKTTSNISSQVSKEGQIQFCRNCERYLFPPQTWIQAQPESRELLAILLKRLQGLNKVRIVDASFVWTEPHSRRIRIKITVQGETSGVILQETFEVEFVVLATQCPDCARSYTVHTWRSSVQLRQKVPHKRTFLYLEQLILRYHAHVDCVSIKESRDGIDFFFAQPNHAIKFVDFLSNVAPIRQKRSEQLISTDTHTGASTYKFSHSVEIAPICRDDIVVLPRQVANKLSNISRIVLCTRVTSSLQFTDPNTLQTVELPADIYWRTPFEALANQAQLKEFIVLDSELLGPIHGKNVLADVTVANSADMSQSWTVRSHLGGLLHPGDHVLGYYLANTNLNNSEWDSIPDNRRPDVVLVKKHYPQRRVHKYRNWKLKRMAKEHNEQVDNEQIDRAERDYELFLRDLEQDQEMRSAINLYKNQEAKNNMDDEEDDEEGPQIDISELLDDMDELHI